MKFKFLFYLLFLLAFPAFSQVELVEIGNQPILTVEEGSFSFDAFANDILKVTFLYEDKDNTQFSNAVIGESNQESFMQPKDGDGNTIGTSDFLITAEGQSITIRHRNGFERTFSFVQEDGMRKIKFDMTAQEQFYGAGERAVDLNLRGRNLKLYNEPHYGYGFGTENLNYCVPVVSSNQGYLLFFDNPQNGYFDIGKKNEKTFEFATIGGEMTFYLIAEKDYVAQVEKLAGLTGSQPLPPRWALGHLQSRFGYKTQEEALEIMQQTLDEDIPVDAVVLDLFWFGKGEHGTWNMGNLDWDRENFPHPDQLINDFAKNDIKTILITEPFMLQESFNYKETADKGLLATDSLGNPYVLQDFYFGKGGILDVFKPETQDWIWQQYKKEIERGVSGWWVDLAEPEKHPSDIYHVNGKADQVHNIYGHFWDKMLFEKYEEEYPNVRLFNLNRSGYAGSGRYAVYPWTGDVSRSWSGLKAQVPLMVSMSMSGVPYIHSDAGGFAMGEYNAELYTRWIQLSVLSPIFRPHGGVVEATDSTKYLAPEPIFWEEETKQTVKKWIEFRYELMPYHYSMALQQQEFGTPLIRPVVDKDNNLVDGQYQWGNWMLVAPIVVQGETQKEVYLPKGKWFYANDNRWINGGQKVSVEAAVGELPYFYKAGAIVPMKPKFKNTKVYPDELIIHYYPSETQTTYTIYQDDGKTNKSVEKGLYNLLDVKAVAKEKYTRMTVCTLNGDYEGKPDEIPLTLVIHDADKPKRVKDKNYTTAYNYDAEKRELYVNLNWDMEEGLDLIVK